LITGHYLNSHNFLLVIFELHDDGLDVLALRLPFIDTFFGI